jgi:hypothetical protein
MGRLAFDRNRLDTLRLALGTSLEELRSIRSNDPEAADTMRMLGGACRTLSEVWLPRVGEVLTSTAMTRCIRSAPGLADISQARNHPETPPHPGWEVGIDPAPVYGPPAPHNRDFDEVLGDIRSGALLPMAAPIDANGHAGAIYTSLGFAPTQSLEIGHADRTPNALKFIDFMSDGLPIGWRENHALTVYYLTDVRVTESTYRLGAYDRDEGPVSLPGLTTVAVVSGYMVISTETTTGEVTLGIGPGEQDPTESFPLASQSTSTYTGAFYPDFPPEFQPLTDEPRFENPDRWTLTKAAAATVDGDGTWQP